VPTKEKLIRGKGRPRLIREKDALTEKGARLVLETWEKKREGDESNTVWGKGLRMFKAGGHKMRGEDVEFTFKRGGGREKGQSLD